MFDFAPAETPEEIQRQEDWVNRTLASLYGATVCLHADRTVSAAPSGDYLIPVSMIRIECDYCPAVAVRMTGSGVHLAPWYFTAGPAVL